MPRKIRDYKDEYSKYQGTPLQKRRRAQRNAARKMMEKDGKVKKGDNLDVDHRKALSKGGSNSRSNLAAISKGDNRSYKRNKNGGIK